LVEVLKGVHLVDGSFANVYILVRSDHLVAIDAGAPGNEEKVLGYIRGMGAKPSSLKLVVVTHAHYDHVGALKSLRGATGARVAAHRDEEPFIEGRRGLPGVRHEPVEVDLVLGEGDVVEGLRVIHVPGHTPGSIALLDEELGAIFIGDLAYEENGALYEIPQQYSLDPEGNRRSIKRLLELKFKHVLPSHGRPIIGRGREALEDLVKRLRI